MCKVEFMLQLMAEEKYCISQDMFKKLDVPHIQELGVNQMTPIAKRVPHFNEFMPDGWEREKTKVDRVFFWKVLQYLNRPLAEFCVRDVKKQHAEYTAQQNKLPKAKIGNLMMSLLTAIPHDPKKRKCCACP